jgi:pimeloyl-ACP methyl ester carboxylesterase
MANGTPVVVLIPGNPGSQLSWHGTRIWPGDPEDLVAYRWNDQLVSDETVPDGLISAVFDCYPIYGPLITALDSWGFKIGQGTLVLSDYDWRKSGETAANLLADRLDSVASTIPDASIALLAHSMGSLVARYYIESGDFDRHTAMKNVRQLITLAGPHFGAPDAFLTRLGFDGVYFLSAQEVQRIADMPQYPELYQAFPPESTPFVFKAEDHATPVDIYSNGIAKTLKLSLQNLAAAKTFREKLDPEKRGKIAYFCFAGHAHPTYTRAELVTVPAGGFQVIAGREELAGDGTVPFLNAVIPNVPYATCTGEHMTIFQDDDVLRHLATLLGRPEQALLIAPRVNLATSRKLLRVGDASHVVLRLPKSAKAIRGALRVERIDRHGRVLAVVSTQNLTLRPHEPRVRLIALGAPEHSGNYRVSFTRGGSKTVEARDSFAVREPSLADSERHKRGGRPTANP